MKQRKELLEQIKKKLLEKQNEMSKQLASHPKDKAFAGQVKDTGDEALSLSLEKIDSSLQQSEINELNLIQTALTRLEKGEYGLCLDCNEPISLQRLEYYPYAARCIACQEEQEAK